MNKNYLIGGVVLVLFILLFLILNMGNSRPFNQVVLSDNNLVISNYPKVDTVLKVGLDVVDIKGLTVAIMPLSEGAKLKFNGELKAHVRYHEDRYYLFIDMELSNNELIRVVSHEIVHIQQYMSRNLQYYDGVLLWYGAPYDLNSVKYEDRPWEDEAFRKEGEISNKIYNILLD